MITCRRYGLEFGGAKQDRTADLLRARQALSQLSYSPLLGSGVRVFFLLVIIQFV